MWYAHQALYFPSGDCFSPLLLHNPVGGASCPDSLAGRLPEESGQDAPPTTDAPPTSDARFPTLHSPLFSLATGHSLLVTVFPHSPLSLLATDHRPLATAFPS